MSDRECEICGSVMAKNAKESPSTHAKRRFCSEPCRIESFKKLRQVRMKLPCEICGKPVNSANAKPRLNRPRLYCGNDCRIKGLAIKSKRRTKNQLAISAATRSAGHSPEPGEYGDSIPLTIPARQVAKDAKHGRKEYEKPIDQRPATRGECKGGARPCPWVSCKYNLYLDVGAKGSLKLHFPHQDPIEVEYSCALDVADKGGSKLRVIGAATNVSRERARQVEAAALKSLRRSLERAEKMKP